MKVQQTSTSNFIPRQNMVTERTSDDDFRQSLENKRSEHIHEKLKGLLERIDIQGKKLSDKMDLVELKEYKRLIKDFLELALQHSQKFSREHFLDNRGRHRIYAIVKKVDEELENLTREVLKREKNHLQILSRIDDIKGLLLDVIA